MGNAVRTDKIYHYTNIESLALILSHKTLRFTRLDRVDDVSEAQTHAGIPFGKYFFVSCWTQVEADNIAQWKMYGGDMKGVRIELPAYPFRSILLEDGPGLQFDGDRTSPLAANELYGRNFMIHPPLVKGMQFAAPVEYVPDVAARYDAAITHTTDESGATRAIFRDYYNLARLKSEIWAFQSEYRFVLSANPISPPFPDEGLLPPISVAQLASMGSEMMSGRDPGITYIDVPLEPTIRDQMVIRVGPLCSLGGRKCIEALVQAFAPGAKVEDSPLKHTVRERTW